MGGVEEHARRVCGQLRSLITLCPCAPLWQTAHLLPRVPHFAARPFSRPPGGMLGERLLRAENLAFDCDVWYPRVREFTFRSHFMPLKRREAAAIVRFYQFANNIAPAQCDASDVDVLRQLQGRLQAALDAHFPGAPAFVRMCGRSPKDGDPLRPQAVLDAYTGVREGLVAAGAADDVNTRLLAIAHTSVLRVTDGADTLALLLTSERVFSDLRDWLAWGEPEQVVFREWEPAMTYDFEFRVFVCGGAVTAISQYDHYGVYPHLAPMRDRIQAALLAFWARVHPHVGQDRYVADFAFLPGGRPGGPPDDRVVLIEISPFMTCTGTAMFSWKRDHGTGSCWWAASMPSS